MKINSVTTTSAEFCRIDLHYRFFDNSHDMDAIVQNNCELDFLRLIKTIAATCRYKIIIEIEPKVEGGLINRYKIKEGSGNKRNTSIIATPVKIALLSAIFIAPTTMAVSGINEVIKNVVDNRMRNPVTDSLGKKKLQLEIEKIRTDIELQRVQKKHDSLENVMLELEVAKATEDFRRHLIKINEKRVANKWRYNFYQKLARYDKISSVSTQVLKQQDTVTAEFLVEKSDFIGIADDATKQLEKMERVLDILPYLNSNLKIEKLKLLDSSDTKKDSSH